ncbi:MAG TPA: hypothetical protein VG605_15720, partial [Puia sp.]|nr:hypothetical protein [Puia sp.]
MRKLPALLIALSLTSACLAQQRNPRLARASRSEKNGWIYVHLEGSPKDIGYQHGFLLAGEIDDLIKSFKVSLPHLSGKDWSFYRDAVKKMDFWDKIDKEYQDEITGITEGLRDKGKRYDVTDIVVLNANIELSQYYVPMLEEKAHPGSTAANNKAPGNCSAFIATGSYTADGKI